ncbi:hypothetical protein BGX20_003850 [Mortierella sp. AD010]|nr:hypothetical protein BGX20_003850 [Mortierella sp. AD010]
MNFNHRAGFQQNPHVPASPALSEASLSSYSAESFQTVHQKQPQQPQLSPDLTTQFQQFLQQQYLLQQQCQKASVAGHHFQQISSRNISYPHHVSSDQFNPHHAPSDQFNPHHAPSGQTQTHNLSMPKNKQAIAPRSTTSSIVPRSITPSVAPRGITPSVAPRSITPSVAPRSITPSLSAGDIAKTSQQQPESSTKPVDKRKSFWLSPEIDALVDWITDPDNYEKLNKKKPISGQKVSDIHAEIADYINSICQSGWDKHIVKSKIEYAKKKYDQARAISQRTGAGDTEQETLREQIQDICPHFDRFHEVYGGSLSRNPPPFKESVVIEDVPPPRKRPCRQIVEEESESSDLEIQADQTLDDFISEDAIDGDRESTRSSSVTARGSGSAVKRRKNNIKSPEEYRLALRRTQDSADKAEENRAKEVENRAREVDEFRKDLRRREMLLEARERDFGEKLLEREKRHDEMLKARELALEERFNLRLQQLDQERAEINQEKAALKQRNDEIKAIELANALLKQEIAIVKHQVISQPPIYK